jgi:hypothetical protein
VQDGVGAQDGIGPAEKNIGERIKITNESISERINVCSHIKETLGDHVSLLSKLPSLIGGNHVTINFPVCYRIRAAAGRSGIDPEKALANGLWFSVPYHRASERSTFQLRHARRDAPHPILGE